MASEKKDYFEPGDVVVVVGGKLDNTGIIDTNVTIGNVDEVGCDDLMVTVGPSTRLVVSKSLCVRVHVDKDSLLNNRTRPASIGDMIFFKGKISWRDKEETIIAGTIYEIRVKDGRSMTATVHTGTEMVELPYDQLLVLQAKS